MKKLESILSYVHSRTSFCGVAILLIVLASATHGQLTKDSDHKPDSNLRSRARINPATLAMEFSIPLASYPGRGGNSLPVTFDYSSKVWTMRQWDFHRTEQGGWGTQIDPFRFTFITSVMPLYGERTLSGWSSSLRPISIIPEVESFSNDGTVGSVSSFPQSPESETSCQLIQEYSSYSDPACPWGRHTYVYECSVPEECCESNQYTVEYCYTGPGGEEGPGPGPTFPVPDNKVKRLRLQMPDGSTREFRKDDHVYDCNVVPCVADEGTYLSVDGTGLRLVMGTTANATGFSTLFMPDGGRYVFETNPDSGDQTYIDKNGNKITFDFATRTWTDTLERQIADPLPAQDSFDPQDYGEESTFQLPSLGNQNAEYSQTWTLLKLDGCVSGTEPSCVNSALENPSDVLLNQGNDTCFDRDIDHPLSNPLFPADPTYTEQVITQTNPQYWYQNTYKFRVCGGLFNPIVLHELKLRDGAKYKFKYNRYGEISKIIYPTGAYERFVYDQVLSLSFASDPPYGYANRGVVERWVSVDGITETQQWKYESAYSSGGLRNATTAPDGSKTEAILLYGGSPFGFDNPLAGKTLEERTYSQPLSPNDPQSGVLLTRTLNDYVVAPPRLGGNSYGTRDARIKRSVSIGFEPGSTQALARLSTMEYDDGGSTDPEFFSHLNPKRQKAYHFVSIPKSVAESPTLTWTTIEGWFTSDKLASVSETDYSYDSSYKARGFLGRPTETRSLNPTNLSDVLAKSQPVYDETAYFDNSYSTTNWEDPNSTLRGNITTAKTWNKDTNTWLEAHAMYDNFGNVRKMWDASADATKFVETQYDPQYKYAYPTKVISPAPATTSSDPHSTDQPTIAETTYDFTTGLPLSMKDGFGQISKTEYDSSLRPVRVFADNFAAPESQTIYGVPDQNGQYPENQRFVKVRKQIDGTNWDEAITWADGLGRTIKTQATDSQGTVFAETHYDTFGRVDRMTNPFRAGDTVYWSKTRYDEMGRAVESYAPTELANLGSAQSLGVTSFDISTVSNYVGTVVTSTDASGRKGRSITNALGQILRVDEPTATGGTADADLGALATPAQATTYKYDLYGKMVEVTQGVQKRWFKYDSLGRLIRVRQPEQEVNTALNLVDSFNTSGQWTAGFTYDVLGSVLTATDANGVMITNAYDRAGRVKTRTYSDSTPPVSFYYDGKGLDTLQSPNFAKGKLTKVTSSVSETRYKLFDNLGRLTETEQRTPVDGENVGAAVARISKYTYNLSGALVEEEYPSGRKVRNEFESDGDLLNVSSKRASGSVYTPFASNFSYNASGGISQMKLGNGRWEMAKFNNRMQVTELGLGVGPTNAALWKVSYEYGELDPNGAVVTAKNTGNIARQTLTVPGTNFVQSYKYDSLYRLTEASEKTGSTVNWTQTWGYDRFGNRLLFAQNLAGAASNTTPTVNQNTNRFDPNQGFTYDKNGNVIGDVDAASTLPRTFVFNGDNKQAEVKKDGVTVGRYYYDGEGKRVKKVTDTETTVFVYSAGKLVAEYSTQISQSPIVAYTTTDHLGSPRIITDAVGQVKSRRDFLPFGEDLFINVGARSTALQYGSNTDDIKQKFTGYLKDNETGLDFAEARMYETRLGRFTTVDPLLASGKSANPQTFNRYIYVGNNPLVTTDPSGLDWFKQKDGDKWKYQYFENDPGKEWEGVDFGGISNLYLRVDNICGSSKCDETRYLNRYGGSLSSEEYVQRQRTFTPAVSFCTAGIPCVTNTAELPDAWEGLKRGSYNFAAGTVNASLEFPVFATHPVSSQRSIGGMFGVPLIADYAEYDNEHQRLYGIQTQIGLMALTSLAGGAARSAARSGTESSSLNFVGPRQLPYDPRVRMRALEEPVSHNFPYSFDNIILSTNPVAKPNGYRIFQHPGTMNRHKGVFEIGVTKDFVIDHRFFRP
jgi:RHS repeat-associated protein